MLQYVATVIQEINAIQNTKFLVWVWAQTGGSAFCQETKTNREGKIAEDCQRRRKRLLTLFTVTAPHDKNLFLSKHMHLMYITCMQSHSHCIECTCRMVWQTWNSQTFWVHQSIDTNTDTCFVLSMCRMFEERKVHGVEAWQTKLHEDRAKWLIHITSTSVGSLCLMPYCFYDLKNRIYRYINIFSWARCEI